MRSVRRIGAVVLFLALVITLPAYGGRGNGKGKGNGQGDDKQSDRGDRGDRGKSDKREFRGERDRNRDRVVVRERERVVVRERGNAYGHDRLPPGQAKKIWGERRAREFAHEHKSWRVRGGYRGYMVPRERFVVYFGPRHVFRVHHYPVVIVAGYPRFHYNGFYVTLIDPWPEYWAPDWYEDDDVYIDYVDDGYYMFNRHHPGVAIAVNISL